MTGTLTTITCKDWRDEQITTYEMDISFPYARQNFTYFSLEGESKDGFTHRVSYDIKKLYGNDNFKWTERKGVIDRDRSWVLKSNLQSIINKEFNSDTD